VRLFLAKATEKSSVDITENQCNESDKAFIANFPSVSIQEQF
jgi:hypothetical protein